MKKHLIIIPILLALLLGACAAQPAPTDGVASGSEATSSQAQSQPQGMTQAQKDVYTVLLTDLYNQGFLQSNWEGTPAMAGPEITAPWIDRVEIQSAVKEGDIITVTAQGTGYAGIDYATMAEAADFAWGGSITGVDSQGIPLGEVTVQIRDTQGLLTPIACQYQPYESPGTTWLKARNEELRPQLEASEKLDVTQYDEVMVNLLWRQLALQRYIPTPQEITQWDLDSLEELVIYASDPFMEAQPPQGFALDGRLLGRLTNLKILNLSVPLQDYSILGDLTQLDLLIIYDLQNYEQIMATPDLSTLRCKVRRLELHDPFGTIDLSNAQAEEVYIGSWSSTVDAVKGGETVKSLYWMGTRSDTRIINKESFPNAQYLNLYFASTYERVRDLSQLATFGPEVQIDLCLADQACNQKTLESLAGVRLDYLELQPSPASPMSTDTLNGLVAQVDVLQMAMGDNATAPFTSRVKR